MLPTAQAAGGPRRMKLVTRPPQVSRATGLSHIDPACGAPWPSAASALALLHVVSTLRVRRAVQLRVVAGCERPRLARLTNHEGERL